MSNMSMCGEASQEDHDDRFVRSGDARQGLGLEQLRQRQAPQREAANLEESRRRTPSQYPERARPAIVNMGSAPLISIETIIGSIGNHSTAVKHLSYTDGAKTQAGWVVTPTLAGWPVPRYNDDAREVSPRSRIVRASMVERRGWALTRVAVILHERLGNWVRQLHPRLHDQPIRWFEPARRRTWTRS